MTQNSPHANSIPEEWLSAYLDDELSAEQRQLVEAAVKEQPQLAQLLDELIATRRLIQQLPAFPTSSSRRSPLNTKSEVSDLDDGLDSPDDSSNSSNLTSASERQLQQRLADDRPSVDLMRSDETDSSFRPTWRMLTLAASLIGVAALGATMWYQSDRWNKLAFDTSTDNRVGSAMVPEGLVDEDSGPKAFSSAENQVAPMAAPAMDALGMQRSATEGGIGAMGGETSGQEFAGGLGGMRGGGFGTGGLGTGGQGSGGQGSGGLGSGGLGGGIGGSGGAAPTSPTFDFTPKSNDQLSHKEAFNQLHDDAKAPNAGQAGPGGGNLFGAPNALENLKPSSPSVDMSADQMLFPQLPSASPAITSAPSVASPSMTSPSLTSPAPPDLAMEFRASPNQAGESLAEPNAARAIPMKSAPVTPSATGPTVLSDPINTAPGAPSPAASVPTDPANQFPSNEAGAARKVSPAIEPSPASSKELSSGQSVEPLPSPAASNTMGMEGMKAKDRLKGSSESRPAGDAEAMRGLDDANSAFAAPSNAPSIAPSTAPLSEARSTQATKNEATKNEASEKSLQPKSQDKNQVLISKSALYRSPAWSEAAVTAQLDGNPLYRPMLSLLSDTSQDKSRKPQSDAKANQADESVLTAVVRLTANQRTAVIEQSKQLGIEPVIKDDGQTAWVLFLSATELDRLLESANQQEKLSIFWISPAKQSASGDRRVLIVNPF